MTSSTWSSIPWTTVGNNNTILHKRRIPYVPNATYLQTLDLWVSGEEDTIKTPGLAPDPPAAIPHRKGPWIVYIHGGAWRDPLVDSSSFESAALRLFEEHPSISIGGIAALNYRLSPHPLHPTHPSPPRESGVPVDAARTARHPDHIRDVLTGLSYLHGIGALGDEGYGYVLVGHSCGATLAFQAVMDQRRWSFGFDEVTKIPLEKPRVVVGLNGLYDLPAFLQKPDEAYRGMVPIYDSFTRGAFGDDKGTWASVCPTVVDNWEKEWPEGRKVVLAQSHTDELVPYSQTELMKRKLVERAPARLVVEEVPVTGKHNEMWQSPDELVKILVGVVKSFEGLMDR